MTAEPHPGRHFLLRCMDCDRVVAACEHPPTGTVTLAPPAPVPPHRCNVLVRWEGGR